MLRKITGILTLPLPFLHPRPLLFRPFPFPFCTLHHPVLEQLETVVKEGEFEQLLVEMAKLNPANKRSCIEKVLQRIKQQTLPQYTIVNEKFVLHLKRFPDLHIAALLHRIDKQLVELKKMATNRQEDGKKIAIKDINTCYTLIFDILKKMPRKEVLEHEVKVYKSFADYHQTHLALFVEPKKVREVLKKGLDFYKSALGKLLVLVEGEDQRGKAMTEEEKEEEKRLLEATDMDDWQEEKIDRLQGSSKIRRFLLTEEYCQVLYKVFNLHNYLTDPRIKDTLRPRTKLQLPFEYHPGIYTLLPHFEKALSLFQEVSERAQSQYFYKVRKTFIEMRHEQRMLKLKGNSEAQEKEVEDYNRRMEEMTEELIEDIENTPLEPETIEIFENLSIILLSLKSNKLVEQDVSEEEYKKRLVEEIREMLGLFRTQELRNLISAKVCDAVRATMKINIEPLLGRLPRITRCKSKRRRQ